ncbi:MAG TPA: hypothetical protein VL947_02825, partial [Cytophagales bacterium]|nr:hypothetical protein [Cytophagales bacterium]
YRDEIVNPEHTLTFMISKVVPGGFEGFVTMGYLATLFTSFCVIVNTATSLFTLDIYNSYCKRGGDQHHLIATARIFIILFVVISIIGAFEFDRTMSFFQYTTLILELIAPISASVFIVAIYTKRTPSFAAIVAIVFSLPTWWMIKTIFGMTSINIAGVLFLVLSAFMLLCNWLFPAAAPVVLKEKYAVRYERSLLIVIWGIFLITIAASCYTILI